MNSGVNKPRKEPVKIPEKREGIIAQGYLSKLPSRAGTLALVMMAAEHSARTFVV